MKALLVKNGDLVLGPGGFGIVEGTTKVQQDLSHSMREPFGNDRFHPKWGTVLPDFVGGLADQTSALLIRSEITRLVQNYLIVQQEQMTRAANAGRRPRFSTNELINEIEGIDIHQLFDRFFVRVRLLTLSEEQVVLLATVRA
jgi:hypothetical protein